MVEVVFRFEWTLFNFKLMRIFQMTEEVAEVLHKIYTTMLADINCIKLEDIYVCQIKTVST